MSRFLVLSHRTELHLEQIPPPILRCARNISICREYDNVLLTRHPRLHISTPVSQGAPMVTSGALSAGDWIRSDKCFSRQEAKRAKKVSRFVFLRPKKGKLVRTNAKVNKPDAQRCHVGDGRCRDDLSKRDYSTILAIHRSWRNRVEVL